MSNLSEPGEIAWSLVEPVWNQISIYEGPDVFLRQFEEVRPEVGDLFAAHWCHSEVCNGGFHQFFSNPTGVLAPEALDAFRAIGLDELKSILAEAMRCFGQDYPRDRVERIDRLEADPDVFPFRPLEDRFYAWLHAEENRFERMTDVYATLALGKPT